MKDNKLMYDCSTEHRSIRDALICDYKEPNKFKGIGRLKESTKFKYINYNNHGSLINIIKLFLSGYFVHSKNPRDISHEVYSKILCPIDPYYGNLISKDANYLDSFRILHVNYLNFTNKDLKCISKVVPLCRNDKIKLKEESIKEFPILVDYLAATRRIEPTIVSEYINCEMSDCVKIDDKWLIQPKSMIKSAKS